MKPMGVLAASFEVCAVFGCTAPLAAQTSTAWRWAMQNTQIYFENFDKVALALGGVFSLSPPESLAASRPVLSSYAAVYQIAIQVPRSIPDRDYAVVATLYGLQSPQKFSLSVQQA